MIITIENILEKNMMKWVFNISERKRYLSIEENIQIILKDKFYEFSLIIIKL